jgi:prepilin-type N-terminal cleavage/methylation domain-containing protein
MASGKKGFTLIELIIAVVIVGILAAVSVTMMNNTIQKGIRNEAISIMATIRTAELLYYAEYGAFKRVYQNEVAEWAKIGIKPSDLNGQYYSMQCFTVWLGPQVECDPTDSHAPERDKIDFWGEAGSEMYMNLYSGKTYNRRLSEEDWLMHRDWEF